MKVEYTGLFDFRLNLVIKPSALPPVYFLLIASEVIGKSGDFVSPARIILSASSTKI